MTHILFTLVLCFGLWSIPASAAPFDIPAHARAMREVGRALRIDHVAADWRAPARFPSAIHVPIRSHETRAHTVIAPTGTREGAGLGMRMAAPQRLNVVAGIPEPSSTVLFGIGVLVALQAIPRKSSLEQSDGLSAGRIADRAC